ncbi:hypothetical protein GQ464_006515 [Rhodocaloribacter litoris]|uniref:hypothetical protein n=1 Tax=Rhodocaloribacter litoris TaxID=2558931 RepID=UPI00141E05F1|nr:hypothetical protein [Rhodocaloribacter litoris]QXD16592.1 hypothetical protein GQ464_006515 [Rhodocaloribacter litoris]GIV61118.1 MAG: hypothetical protein KatS3mg043_2207 [Rhodothermaceae bacterium]
MRSLVVRLAFPLAVSLFLAACDSGSGMDEDPNSVAGTWVGEVTSVTAQGDTIVFQINMTIQQQGIELSGGGTVTGPNGPDAFTIVEGAAYFHPMINMDLLFSGPPLGELNGVVSDDRRTITGTISGPGFSGLTVLTVALSKTGPPV